MNCAFTIREFCDAHKISQAFYYIMKNEGWGPAEMHAGRHVLISYEAATDWRREREAAAIAGTRRNLKGDADTGAGSNAHRAGRKPPPWSNATQSSAAAEVAEP